MKCPKCGREEGKVLDSRPFQENMIRRRRVCERCNHRWSTVEFSMGMLVFYQNEIEKVKGLEKTVLKLSTAGQGWDARWTETEEAQLIALYHENLPYSKIAEKLGRPYRGIEHRIYKLRKEGRL